MIIRNKNEVELKLVKDIPEFEIEEVLNPKWLNRKITHPLTQKPGLALAGYMKYLNRGSLQVFGKTEIGYLNQLIPEECQSRLSNFLSSKIPGIIVTENQKLKESIVNVISRNKTS